jgi:hypothetical protein
VTPLLHFGIILGPISYTKAFVASEKVSAKLTLSKLTIQQNQYEEKHDKKVALLGSTVAAKIEHYFDLFF